LTAIGPAGDTERAYSCARIHRIGGYAGRHTNLVNVHAGDIGEVWMRRAALAPIAATLTAAALLAAAAVYTVERAGCDDPGHYVRTGESVELVGGCLEPGDLPVGPAPAANTRPDDSTQVRP
jgi:hypothetical protein